MQSGRTVIVGAGLSGLRLAEKLTRLGHTGPITLIGAEPHPPYDRPPLSKTLLTRDDEPRPVFLGPIPEVELRTGVRATDLDTGRRRLTLDDGETLTFDRLVIATGVRPRTIPGFAAAHVLRTWEDCLRLRAALADARHVTVIGAGVLGCEIAASARARGIEVTLVELLDQPLAPVLGATVGEVIAALHRGNGVQLRCGTRVSGLVDDGRGKRVVFADGGEVTTDLVVVAVGATPNTEWLAGSGVDVDGGVVCDRTGQTSVDGVFAVGDVARIPHPLADRPVRLEHWTSAVDTAALVADNLCAAPDERRGLTEVPYFWSDQYKLKLQCLGLPAPGDELTIAAGSLADTRFLGLYSRDGMLTGAVAVRMAAALTRCRPAIGRRAPLAELLREAPWTPAAR